MPQLRSPLPAHMRVLTLSQHLHQHLLALLTRESSHPVHRCHLLASEAMQAASSSACPTRLGAWLAAAPSRTWSRSSWLVCGGPQAARAALPPPAGRAAGGAAGRAGLQRPTRGPAALDVAAAGRAAGGAAGGGVGVRRDGPAGLAANRRKPLLTGALVHPARAGRRVLLADAGRAGGLHPALRPAPPAGLPGP
jgi:hypothetical protein